MTEQDQIDRPSWKKKSFIEKRGTYRKGVDLFFVEGVTVVTTGHEKIKNKQAEENTRKYQLLCC